MKTETQIIISSTIFVLLFGILSSAIIRSYSDHEEESFTGSWACTADVYVCPDGSTVSRTPPYCQFAPCIE